MDGIVETYHSFQLTSSIHSFQLIPTLPLPSCRLAMDGIVETLLRFVTRLLVSRGCLVQGKCRNLATFCDPPSCKSGLSSPGLFIV